MSDYITECSECEADVGVDFDDVLSELSAQCECGCDLGISLSYGTIKVDACESCRECSYDDGFSDGKDEGYDSGYDTGFEEGQEEEKAPNEGGSEPSPDEIARIKDLGYEEGYADAHKEFNNA